MAHETIVAGIEAAATSGQDDIDERFHNARDERIATLTLALLEDLAARISAGEAFSKAARTTAVKAMLETASQEAFCALVAADAASEGLPAPLPQPPEVFDLWENGGEVPANPSV